MPFHTQQAGRYLSGIDPSVARMQVEAVGGGHTHSLWRVSTHSPMGRLRRASSQQDSPSLGTHPGNSCPEPKDVDGTTHHSMASNGQKLEMA